MPDQLQPKLDSRNLPWSTDWTALFGRPGRLILEIGFGYGHFLEYLQRTRPDANIVGLEISSFCLSKVERTATRRNWGNVRLIHSPGETALHHLFEPESISEIHVNFPDPWFKKRHSGRRLMQRDTLDAMVSRLEPGGHLYLATDILAYAEMSAELLADTPGLTNAFETPWVHHIEDRVVTKYERKAQQAGRDCHYFLYRRNNTTAPHIPVIKDLDMPHIVLQTPLSPDEIVGRFSRTNHAEGDIRVNLIEAFRAESSLLFEVYIHEPTIDQHIAVLYVPKGDIQDQYTLKLSPLGNPRSTEGVHLAVKLLGDWIASLHDETQVIQSKVKAINPE